MSDEDVALARRSIDLFIAGDREAAWALWAEDCVAYPPRDWPERGPFHGREQLRETFEGWNIAFGSDWSTHMRIAELHDLHDGRVLFQLEFETSGRESGLPVDQQLATISTVRDGKIVRGDYFMRWDDARKAAGLE